MNKKVILGQIREITVALGALAFAEFEGWPSIVGLVVAIAAVVLAVKAHEGKEVIGSLVRKAVSATPAVLVAFGVVDVEKAASLTALLIPIVSMVFSYKANGAKLPKGEKLGLFFVALLSLSMFSCAGSSGVVDLDGDYSGHIRDEVTGLVITEEAGQLAPRIDSVTVTNWLGKIFRLSQGESIKDVIAPISTPYGSK
jgi:hypothetical protein